MFRSLHEYDSSLIFSRIHSTWQTSQSNIDRTNTIIKKLASQFAGNTGVVPVIAPLNEWVFARHRVLGIDLICFILRPAGFFSSQMLSVTKQVCL